MHNYVSQYFTQDLLQEPEMQLLVANSRGSYFYLKMRKKQGLRGGDWTRPPSANCCRMFAVIWMRFPPAVLKNSLQR